MPRLDPTVSAAYDECRRLAQTHYENFPVGSMLIPKRLRPHVHALYAFMRTADDYADLPTRTSAERLNLLASWRDNLHLCFSNGTPSNAIFLALRDTIRRFNLAPEPFERVMEAFEFDARGQVRFATYEDLHWYTRRSADPVGQLVLALFGYGDEERIRQSNDICTALQLINFLQDAKADLSEGRCYFPVEDMNLFGVDKAEALLTSPATARIVLYECDRIEQLLAQGAGLSETVRGRLRFELRAVLIGARMMIEKIRALSGDTIRERPSLNSRDRRMILIKALV